MKVKALLKPVIWLPAFLMLTGCPEPNYQPPGCEIQSPLENSDFFLGESISILVEAWDTDGSISIVELLFNGTTISSLNTSPYSYVYELTDIEPDKYTLKAEATDDQDLGNSDEIEITVNPALKSFSDTRDGKSYRYTTIGDQTWMAENLAYLPEIHSTSDSSGILARYYVYDYNGNDLEEARTETSYLTTGVLYNFIAAQEACPAGWHLPGKSEWDELLNYLDSEHQDVSSWEEDRGVIWISIAKYMRSTYGWDPHKANGLNTHGFSAVPTGAVSFEMNYLFCMPCRGNDTNMAGWWTSTSSINSFAYAFDTFTGLIDVHEAARKNDFPKVFGLSVRCVQDH